MYRLINENADAVLGKLEHGNEVARYCKLRGLLVSGRIDAATDVAFQRLYRSYWGLARRNTAFCGRYFRLLARCASSRDSDIGSIVKALSKASGASTTSLEFSFATKIAHMIEPRLPVFDSLVAAFYLFVKPPNEKPFNDRLLVHLEFHAFLRNEYARVIKHRLLRPALREFRTRFPVANDVCDERILDWLLWSWASLLRDGAQQKGELLYR